MILKSRRYRGLFNKKETGSCFDFTPENDTDKEFLKDLKEAIYEGTISKKSFNFDSDYLEISIKDK